ncbi:hypothetical protein BHE74_00008701 [Ensete ventricosum]|nr:hypothetical protein GW17_00028848 [Ensete ventricosum]RWW82807.1 hypothetical protein BHE74_00008701 [Ensete ventricosum]RZR87652.1 hypothetical protein BHM03_00015097 [Ensete ventricosum]
MLSKANRQSLHCFQVNCGVRGDLDPACNAVGYVDRAVWGINHLYAQPVWIRSRVSLERCRFDFSIFLVHWIQRHVFVEVWHSERLGMLLYVLFAEIVFWAVVAGILHKLGLYWKL